MTAALALVPESEGVSVTFKETGIIEIAVAGRVAPATEAAIASAIPEPARQGFAEAVRRYRVETKDQLSPAEPGPFSSAVAAWA